MAVLVSEVLSRVNKKLNDLSNIRWTSPEHLEAVNDAQKAILEARPDLFETYAFVTLVAGVLQSVPADCYLLLDVIGNADGSNNLTSPITFVSRSTLDRQRRGWMSMTANRIVAHWTRDKREKTKFFVAPPQPTSNLGKVQIRYAKRPAVIPSIVSATVMPDECINALYHFSMTRALEKDEKFSGSPQAAAHMEKFALFLGVKAEAENQSDDLQSQREDVS